MPSKNAGDVEHFYLKRNYRRYQTFLRRATDGPKTAIAEVAVRRKGETAKRPFSKREIGRYGNGQGDADVAP
jgi:hypothetical protein